MEYTKLMIDIATQLIVAAITFVLGLAASKLPRSWDRHKLQQFFGEAFLSNGFKVVYGTFTRKENSNPERLAPIYQKIYSNNKTLDFPAPYKIAAESTLRSISYFLQEFSKYRKQPFSIHTDEDVLASLDSTFLSIGGPLSNEITDLALQDKNNRFLKFSIPEITTRNYATIHTVSESTTFKMKGEAGHDYGIIVKIKNSRSPKNYYFVCAGIGSMGTSAAVWYLAKNWKTLYKEFGAKEFGVVVEVSRAQDSTTTRAYYEV